MRSTKTRGRGWRWRMAGILLGGMLLPSVAEAQETQATCFALETKEWTWEALELQTSTIEQPPSLLFRRIPVWISLDSGEGLDPRGGGVATEGAGGITSLRTRDGDAYPQGHWTLGDSLRLAWETPSQWVAGDFAWDPEGEAWQGLLIEGTDDEGPGHWRAHTLLLPFDCSAAPPRPVEPITVHPNSIS